LSYIIVAAAIAGFLSIISAPFWIKFQKSRNMGQRIRVDGPQTHIVKAGTPTMGGIVILISSTVGYLISIFAHYLKWKKPLSFEGILVLIVFTLFGIVGLFDDYLSIKLDRSLGLRAKYKILFQLLISIIFAFILINYCGIDTKLEIPIIYRSIELGYGYYLLIPLMIISTSNAVNLTDGLDGLVAGTTAAVLGVFSLIGYVLSFSITFEYGIDLAILSAAIMAASIGLLWWNAAPADIFLGDTGSLSLGAVIAILAILLKVEIYLIVIGGLFVIETLSVIIQVLYFKLTKKRVFLMAPIHHHFELLGWPEIKIIIRFWLVSLIFAIIGYFLFYIKYIG
jgi:phospho-N-acetylmuramoyl-pentapeptide-transferase